MRSTSATLTERHPIVTPALVFVVTVLVGVGVGQGVGRLGVRAVEMLLELADE